MNEISIWTTCAFIDFAFTFQAGFISTLGTTIIISIDLVICGWALLNTGVVISDQEEIFITGFTQSSIIFALLAIINAFMA